MIQALLLVGLGAVLIVVSGKLSKDRVLAEHGVFTRETVRASNANKTIPRWVSILNLGGYVAVFVGVGAGIAQLV